MNVLFVDQFGDLGGAQLCMLDLMPAIVEKGWRVLAAVPSGPFAERLRRSLEFGHFRALTKDVKNVSLAVVKHKDAVRRRDKLAANLPTAELLRGSLLKRIIRHKSGCPKCDRGEGHPVLVLAVSEPGGKVRHISLRPEQKQVVEEWIENYRRLKNQIEEVCDLNQTLLRPEP